MKPSIKLFEVYRYCNKLNERVFQSLRDGLYEQIDDLDDLPNLMEREDEELKEKIWVSDSIVN